VDRAIGCLALIDVLKQESKSVGRQVLNKDEDDGPYLDQSAYTFDLSRIQADVPSEQSSLGQRTEADPMPDSSLSFLPNVSSTKPHLS
jgi:hypothetical protein